MSLVDPYHDRYLDKMGNVIGVSSYGPVGNQRMTHTNLGLGGLGGRSPEPESGFGVLTPPGSTKEGKFDILTPPGSLEGGYENALENLFLQQFLDKRRK